MVHIHGLTRCGTSWLWHILSNSMEGELVYEPTFVSENSNRLCMRRADLRAGYRSILDGVDDDSVDSLNDLSKILCSNVIHEVLAPKEIRGLFARVDLHPERERVVKQIMSMLRDTSDIVGMKTVWQPFWDECNSVFEDLKVVYIARDVAGSLLSCNHLNVRDNFWYTRAWLFDNAEYDILVSGPRDAFGVSEEEMPLVRTAMYRLLSDYCHITNLIESGIPAMVVSYESLTANHRVEIERMSEFLEVDVAPDSDPLPDKHHRREVVECGGFEPQRVVEVARQCCEFWNEYMADYPIALSLPGPAITAGIPMPNSLFCSSFGGDLSKGCGFNVGGES